MRPVVKGQAPRPEYKHYRDALDDLTARLGPYCSYCEQPIPHAPEIDHVQPKSLVPDQQHSWENFLLACKSCNSAKGNTPVNLEQIAFPDTDNTFRALDYHQDGKVVPASDLEDTAMRLIEETIKLVKLHRHPDAPDKPSRRDQRAARRQEAWMRAQRQLDLFEEFQNDARFTKRLAKLIAEDLAPITGFFSVWMTVFADHPAMLNRFICAFRGTDCACFDQNGRPVHRPGGRI